MGSRKAWDDLKPEYRQRLIRDGVTRESHAAGTADLKRARGHKSTPEHPKDAERRPGKYKAYQARKSKLVDKEILVITVNGLEMHKLNGKDRDVVAAHWKAMHEWMRGRRRDLTDFEGKTVRDVDADEDDDDIELETDPNAIFLRFQEEQTQVPSIYETPK